jgi:pyruvate dehydrogenase E2 component (dihydrolipoamide acetyltransferase)
VSKEFKLPELGENISSGDLVRMLVKQGESISEGQPVMELETDKAVIEVPSSVSGKVQDIRVKEGQKVKVGETILIIEDGTNGNRPRTEAKPETQPQGSNGQKPQQTQQQQQPPKQQAQPSQQQPQPTGRQQRAETTPPITPDEMSTNEQADARVDMQ